MTAAAGGWSNGKVIEGEGAIHLQLTTVQRRVTFMRSSRWIVVIAFTATLGVTLPAVSIAASAPAGAPSAAATPAATSTGIATADGEESGVTVVVQQLKRGSAGTATLRFTIVNGSNKNFGFGYAMADPKHENADHGSVGGVQLVDEAGKKRYFVVRDTQNKCVCSQKVTDIKPGSSKNLWGKFPAPPANVQKISVVVPHFGPMDDVPISH
jgi:hypothetical protein